MGEANKLNKALRDSKPKIFVFLFAVLILSIIAGTIMYLSRGRTKWFC